MTISNVTQDAALFSEWQHPDGRPRAHYAHLAEVVKTLGTEGVDAALVSGSKAG